MKIINVSSKKTITKFHKIPFNIYKNDKNWIPYIKQDIEKKFNIKTNKIYDGTNAERWIITNEKNELVGRIAAFIHPKTVNSFKQATGSIGFFECINNQDYANKLFDTAKTWLEKKGVQAMDGPINFGERDQFWGLLVKNFTAPPTYGMNYNPEYYISLFENYGFKIYFNQFMYHRDFSPAQQVFVKKSEKAINNSNIYCETVRGKQIEQIAQDFLTVYNDAWGKSRKDFKEMNFDFSLKVMKALKPIMDPDIMIFAYHEKRPVGFYINIPELNQIFKYVKGNMNFIGKMIFLYHKIKKTPTTMYGIVFGVSPDFQGKGVEGAMIKFAEETIIPLNRYKDTVLQWIGDFNPKMINVCENLGAKQYRNYSTYRFLFNKNIKFERAPIVD